MMKAENSVKVDFSLYEYGGSDGQPHPRDIYKNVKPEPITIKWVPQTVYDSIWVLYEFASKEDKEKFLLDPPASFDDADIDENRTQAFYDHWVGGKLSNPSEW